MNRLMAFVSVTCVGVGASLKDVSHAPGDTVAYGELERITGAQCKKITDTDELQQVCSSNCGTKWISAIIDGDKQVNPNQDCSQTKYCSAPQSVSDVACIGGYCDGHRFDY